MIKVEVKMEWGNNNNNNNNNILYCPLGEIHLFHSVTTFHKHTQVWAHRHLYGQWVAAIQRSVWFRVSGVARGHLSPHLHRLVHAWLVALQSSSQAPLDWATAAHMTSNHFILLTLENWQGQKEGRMLRCDVSDNDILQLKSQTKQNT